MPLAAEGRVDGLIISTSPLTAEARDYLDATLPTLPNFQIELRTLVGPEIPQFLVDHSGYASDTTLVSRVQELYELEGLDTWLVCTATGDFLAATCGPDNVSAATTFATFKTDGTELRLNDELVGRFKAQLADVGELTLVSTGSQLTAEAVRVERLPTVAAGAGSFDYRFPSSPEHFIGRAEPLDELARIIEDIRTGTTATRAIQVLSRSGGRKKLPAPESHHGD